MCIRRVEEALARCLAQPWQADYCVAFSGGLDSTALLYAMAQIRAGHPGIGLRAVYVNHHLLPEADAWAEHCRAVADGLAVKFETIDVQVQQGPGLSVEAAAREARYVALAAQLRSEEILLTAHHQDDQLETVLLQLMRGAGVAGLAAMPEATAFGPGRHVRPLLQVDRRQLEAFVHGAGLRWVEDSSNVSVQFDRNFLRRRVIPVLRERWPGAAATVSRTARHMAEAQALLEELARIDLAAAADGDTLKVSALGELGAPRAANLLRYWIRSRGLRPPSTVKLQEILRQMLQSRPDARPKVEWESGHIVRRRGRLYLGN